VETVALIEKKYVEIKGFIDFIIKYGCVLCSLGVYSSREFLHRPGGKQFGGIKRFEKMFSFIKRYIRIIFKQILILN